MTLAAAQTAAIASGHFFPLDEASGDTACALTAATMVDTNTVGSGAGYFGTARDFEASSSECFIGGTAAVPPVFPRAGQEYSGCAVVTLESNSGNMTLLAVYGGAGMVVDFRTTSSAWRHYNDGDGSGGVSAALAAGSSTGSKHLIMWFNDPTNELRGISVDGSAFTTAATGAQSGTSTGAGNLGSFNASGDYFDGLMEHFVHIDDYVWSDADAAALWASGSIVHFDDWDGGGASTVRFRGLTLLGVGC